MNRLDTTVQYNAVHIDNIGSGGYKNRRWECVVHQSGCCLLIDKSQQRQQHMTIHPGISNLATLGYKMRPVASLTNQ